MTNSLDNDSEKRLAELIVAVNSASQNSSQRRIDLNRLLRFILKSRKLIKSSHPDYAQALNRTLEWVANNISHFDVERIGGDLSLEEKFFLWINRYLKWRVYDLYMPDVYPISLDQVIGNEGEQTTLLDILSSQQFATLDPLDININQAQELRRQHLGQRVQQYIEQDSEGLLCNIYLRGRPECNCQILAQRLLLKNPPDRHSEVAKDLHLNQQTYYSFWRRKCLPRLQQLVIDLDKQQDEVPFDTADSSISGRLQVGDDRPQIEQIVNLLIKSKRELLELRLEGKTWEEIACQFAERGEELSISTLRKRGQRALQELRNLYIAKFGEQLPTEFEARLSGVKASEQ